MKSGIILLALVALTFIFQSCKKPENRSNEGIIEGNNKVTVYYFHRAKGCLTCKAIGRISKQTVADSFQADTNVLYQDIDIDLKSSEALAEKYKISYSGLVVANNNAYKDLTNFAFQYARINSDTLRKSIIEQVIKLKQ